MRQIVTVCLLFTVILQSACAQKNYSKHPDTNGKEWKPLFKDDLSNAIYEKGVFTVIIRNLAKYSSVYLTNKQFTKATLYSQLYHLIPGR